jgi:TM2 domain-containing membrane protein YozV
MKNKGIAYLLWFVGGFGTLGLHRFYMGKTGTGLLWLFTGGLGIVGSVYDLLTMDDQVREVNNRIAYTHGYQPVDRRPPRPRNVSPAKPKDSLEKVILKVAKQQSGLVTSGEVALAGSYSMGEVQEKPWKSMAKKSYCDMRVSSSGTVMFYFSEFDPDGRSTHGTI